MPMIARPPSSRLPAAMLLGLLGLLALASIACARTESRFDRSELDRGDAGLVLGEYPLAKNAIVDGDTIKVSGLDASLRLLAIDTEETFKSESAWRAYEQGWEAYLAAMQAKTSRPIKVPTPVGMDAKHFAQEFFRGVTRVRLERDHPKEVRDRFNRYLAYVFVERDGEWLNYAVEATRAGMTPYFTKYGKSRRFDAEFVEAQREAQQAKRGIWAAGAQAYQDYPVRLAWWDERAAFIDEFEQEAEGDPRMIVLTHWDAERRLEALLGEEVELLAAVGEVRQGARGPKRVLLSRRMFQDFPLIFWEEQIYEQSGIEGYRSEYIRVRGVVTSYTDRRSGERQLQIEVHDPRQVILPDYTPPGSGEDDEDEDDDAAAVEAPTDLAPRPDPGPEPDPTPQPEPQPEPPASLPDAIEPTLDPSTSAPAPEPNLDPSSPD
ncbi:thermonuclease family protein [Nannocystaceae bacterium ST9]